MTSYIFFGAIFTLTCILTSYETFNKYSDFNRKAISLIFILFWPLIVVFIIFNFLYEKVLK